MGGCSYVPGTYEDRYKSPTGKTKISRIRYTRYQRSGTTNQRHHLGTGVTFFLPRPHLTKTLLIILIYPLPLHFLCSLAFRVKVDGFGLDALGVVADVCCWFLLHLGLLMFFLHIMFFTPGCFSTYTHPPTLQGFCAEANRFTRKSWWVVGGGWCWLDVQRFPLRKWLHLATQVWATTCCLLIWFITQSGTCTLRPPRLLCCFLLHRQQISSDITSSPLSLTAKKHKLRKD